MPHKTYNTPKRKCVVKTRLTEDERRAFEDKCAALSMSQSEYIRQAIFYSKIAPVIRVTAHSEETLTAVSSLVAQYGKIFLAAVQRGYPIILPEYEPPGFVKGGLHGKLVMLKG